MTTKQRPIKKLKAILISDLHFTPQTLELASEAFLMAQNKAVELKVPLIVCGDTLDTKDIMRAQCVNRVIDLVQSRKNLCHIFLIGNHDMTNEKSSTHSLNFLSLLSNCELIDTPRHVMDMYLMPYQSSTSEFKKHISDKAGIILCHQGVQGANMGHYVQDKTSIGQEEVAGKRIISGHYHKRQDIPLKDEGLWSYVGNSYTLSAGEAFDPPKGFQILMEDGSLEFVPTNLRKHVIIERPITNLGPAENVGPHDIIWLKVTGPYLELQKLDKRKVGLEMFGHANFRFDKITSDSAQLEVPTKPATSLQLLDKVIKNTDETPANKKKLKALAKELLNEN